MSRPDVSFRSIIESFEAAASLADTNHQSNVNCEATANNSSNHLSSTSNNENEAQQQTKQILKRDTAAATTTNSNAEQIDDAHKVS